MKKLLQISILALLFVTYLMIGLSYGAGTCNSTSCSVGGTTPWTADSASYADVNYCVNTCASRGDTVNVPAGTVSWSSPLVITKSISLVGAGAGTTVITSTQSENGVCGSSTTDENCNFMIEYRTSSIADDKDTLFRISGFTLDADFKVGNILIFNNSTTAHNKVRIDNNALTDGNYSEGTSGSDTRCSVMIRGTVYGVMDNNAIGEVPIIRIYGAAVGAGMWSTYGMYQPGTANTFFVEDNTITWDYANHTTWSRALDSTGYGSSWVARYNDYIADPASSALVMLWDSHPSVDSFGTYATRGKEVYGNDMTGMGRFGPRCNGGQSIVFFNRDNDTSATYVPTLVSQMDYANETGLTACGSNAVASEIGRASCAASVNGYTMPQHPHREYEWANWYGATPTKWPGYASTGAIELRNNIDFFNYNTSFTGASGTGCGTLGNRPATCTTGVVYFATDLNCGSIGNYVGVNPATPITGTLYRCSPTNTWTQYYTPYTYPHPLREIDDPDPPEDTTPPTLTNPCAGDLTCVKPPIEIACDDDPQDIYFGCTSTDSTDTVKYCIVGVDEDCDADMTYDEMPNTFDGNTSNYWWNATKADFACGASYTVYARAADNVTPTPNKMTSSLAIQFTIADGTDEDPPVITNTTTQAQSCTAASLLMTISTNEASTCKWSETDEAYADMDYYFSVTGGETVHHSVNITGQACSSTVNRYVRCSDTQGNVNASSTTIPITTDAGKAISGIDLGTGSLTISIGSGTLNINIIP